MYPRVLCFTLALILCASVFADEKKKSVNLYANLSYTVDNSSEEHMKLRVFSCKKNGLNAHTTTLASVKPEGVVRSRDAIYYNTATVPNVAFTIEVDGVDVAALYVNFNSLPDNPTLGNEINPAVEHLDVFVYKDQHEGWVAYWQVLPNH